MAMCRLADRTARLNLLFSPGDRVRACVLCVDTCYYVSLQIGSLEWVIDTCPLGFFPTAEFKVHNPSKRKQAALDTALEEN